MDLPDPKWIVQVDRAGPTIRFGPFDRRVDAWVWMRDQNVNGTLIPLHPVVPAEWIDWQGDSFARSRVHDA